MAEEKSTPLVRVESLVKHYPIRSGLFGRQTGQVHAVDGLSFHIMPAETYALVGESGCGKSTTGRLLLRLEKPTSGRIFIDDMELSALTGAKLRQARRRAQIVFQDPFSSLNPRMTVGAIIGEGLLIHWPHLSESRRRERVGEILATVGLSAEHMDRYPHEFSGGQRQRIGLARALAVEPAFLVCDEAVSALDVSIQAQIINLLGELREKMGLAYLFISHDLAVVRHMASRVGVMYLGHLMEEADADTLFRNPLHPYTRALLSAIPEPDPKAAKRRIILKGDVPRADRPPSGCRFHPRCPDAKDACRTGDIPEIGMTNGRRVKCLLYSK